ncbi:MAG: ATP-binding protein [Syntrophobacteraceae bacterium]
MKTSTAVLPPETKCTRCRGQATIPLPTHHANFCPECFLHYFQTAVSRAMERFGTNKETPLLVAVSGGKDSLALWDVLHTMGYPTTGIHVELGIDGFSEASTEAVRHFARKRDLPLIERSLKESFGYSVQEIRVRTWRKICSVCGLLKRQMLNRLTVQSGFQVLVSGHNLDDEAGRLLGNILRNRTRYLEKLSAHLPSPHPRMPAKQKPLYRLESHEIRTYCRLREIEPLDAKCPLSRGATSHIFKEALDFLETKMPGTKRDFLYSHLDRNRDALYSTPDTTCTRCGEPSFAEICSVCNLLEQLRAKDASAAPSDPDTPLNDK